MSNEYGDAYQGAREDLAIWKRRALEAERALREEKILTERLGNALNDENGPTFMGEPNVNHHCSAPEVVAHRLINPQGEVMTDWHDGPPPDNFTDLCGTAMAGTSVELAFAQAWQVPEGWKLVPLEPTRTMIEAPFAGKVEGQCVQTQMRAREIIEETYRAMIAAAPPAD